MQNYAHIGEIDHTHYITYLSFQLLRNHRILTYKLFTLVLVKPEYGVH